MRPARGLHSNSAHGRVIALLLGPMEIAGITVDWQHKRAYRTYRTWNWICASSRASGWGVTGMCAYGVRRDQRSVVDGLRTRSRSSVSAVQCARRLQPRRSDPAELAQLRALMQMCWRGSSCRAPGGVAGCRKKPIQSPIFLLACCNDPNRCRCARCSFKVRIARSTMP
jgi:hypothetical protein